MLGCRVGNAHSNSSVQWTKDSFGLGLKESLRDTWSNLRILDPNPESKSSKFLPRGHPQIIYNAILLLCNDSMPLCNTSTNLLPTPQLRYIIYEQPISVSYFKIIYLMKCRVTFLDAQNRDTSEILCPAIKW